MSVTVISLIRLKTRYLYCLDYSAYTEIRANLLSLSREKVPRFDNYSNMDKLNGILSQPSLVRVSVKTCFNSLRLRYHDLYR